MKQTHYILALVMLALFSFSCSSPMDPIPLEYIISYLPNGADSGSVPENQVKAEGNSLTIADNSGSLSRNGYLFSGWNTADDGSGIDYSSGNSYTTDANLVLYAKWSLIPTYTVTYDGNGAHSGSVPNIQVKSSGVDIFLANNNGNLVRSAYTFIGWNTEVDGTGTDYAAGAIYSEDKDLYLYAKWTSLPTYTINYNGNSQDSGIVPVNQIKIEGIDKTLSSNTGSLYKIGYTFSGWNTADDGSGSDYAEASNYSVDADITLYAMWSINQYSLSYDGNENTGGSVISVVDYDFMETVMTEFAGSLLRTGHAFTGWSSTSDGSGASYSSGSSFFMPAQNLTLYAQWDVNQYSINYDGNGHTDGSVPSSAFHDYNSNISVSARGSLIQTGYYFTGWNTASDGNGTTYAEGAVISMPAENITLYAQWGLSPTYLVSYNGNGSDGGSVPADSNNYIEGASVDVVSNGTLSRTGYSFSGWNTEMDGSGSAYSVDTTFSMPAGNVTLYAQWDINQYSLSYDGNGNTAGTEPTSLNYEYNSSTIVSSEGSISRIGYTFKNWNTTIDGSGTSYSPGSTLTMPAEGVTLFAQWEINQYTVSYNGNGITSGTVPASEIFDYEDLVTTSESGTLSRIGYIFLCWNTAFDGSGTDYSSSATFNMPAGNVDLYAQWARTYTITYSDNASNSGSAPAEQIKTSGTSLTLASNSGSLLKSDYAFIGWNTASDGTGIDYAAGAVYNIDANLFLYAKWGPTINKVSADNNSLILRTDGTLWAAGYNFYGQLGDGSKTNRKTPVEIMSDVQSISAGGNHSLILKNDGTIWAMGRNNYGQLGDGTTIDRLLPVQIMSNVQAVSAGENHSLFLKLDGSVWSVGQNMYGCLGDGSTTDQASPVEIMNDVQAISAGGYSSLFLKSDGTLWGAGSNGQGQLGISGGGFYSTPIQTLTSIAAIESHLGSSFFLKTNGVLLASGSNYHGQLGNGTTEDILTPIQIMTSVLAFSIGDEHSLIVKTDGSLWASGSNLYGQLGDGTEEDNLSHEKIADNVQSVAAGVFHSFYIKNDGTLWSFGHNMYGQIGDGTTTFRSSPVLITVGE